MFSLNPIVLNCNGSIPVIGLTVCIFQIFLTVPVPGGNRCEKLTVLKPMTTTDILFL